MEIGCFSVGSVFASMPNVSLMLTLSTVILL